MNTTVRLKASDITKDWHVIDAAGRPLGRVASEAAVLLRGKHKPTFEPHLDGGDFVIVVNASQVRVTGKKSEQINYYSHSGYPGGLRTRSYTEQLARFPERILEQAIWGMLPKGPLGKKMMKHLKVYKGPKHPHQSQLVGSERARTARETAVAEHLGEPMKPARLRPLGGVVTILAPVEADFEDAVVEVAPAPEAAVAAAAVVEAETAVAEAAVEEAAAPKRRTRKKAAEATTESDTEAATEPAETEE